MSTIISASIDLNKVDESRVIKGKNKARYYNLTIIVNDTKDQYNNDVSIQQGQSKEERQAKAKAVYIGNGKIVWESNMQANVTISTPPSGNINDDLPF